MTRFKPLALAIALTPLVGAARIKHGIYAHPHGFEIWERGKRVETVVFQHAVGNAAPHTTHENPRILGANWIAKD